MRRLGRTGLSVSVVGFGGGAIRRLEQVAVLREAIKMGVNFIDTAHSYGGGTSERSVGEAIRGPGTEVFVATKTAQRDAKGAERDIRESLQRLGVEKLAILQMHGVGTMKDLGRIVDSRDSALKKAKEYRARGLLDFVGITGAHGPADLRRPIDSEAQIRVCAEAVKTQEFDTVNVSYNIEFRNESITSLIELAKDYDVGVICKKPFGAGRLIKKYGVEELLRFVLANENVSTVIPGMVTFQHVREDVPIGYL